MSSEENVQVNEAQGEINRLEGISGFILPDKDGKLLRDYDRPQYDKLCRERDAAFERKRNFQNANPVETLEAPQSIIEKTNQATKELEAAGFQGESLADQFIESGRDITSEAGIQQLKDDIRQDIEVVNELMEGSDIDIDAVVAEPTVAKLESYKQMRLLAEGDYQNLQPLILKDAQAIGVPSDKVEQMRNFLSTAVSDPLTDDLTNVIIRHVYNAKKAAVENEDI